MGAPYTLVIVNPASANGATGRRWPELRQALDRVLTRWDNQFTVEAGDATRLARAAIEDGYEMIVAVGGDGTLSEVVSGFFAESSDGISTEVIRKDMLLAPVRAGTGGDFARTLELPTRLPESVAHLAHGRDGRCDVGLVTYVDPAGRTLRRAFINIASFGLSGLVDDKVNRTSKALGGTASFLVGLSRALVEYRAQPVKIRVDGEEFYEGPMVIGVVANGQYFGGGMRFAPEAQPDDGQFEVLVQTRTGLREVARVRDLYSGRVTDWDVVRHRRGRTVEVESLGEAPVLWDVDGEQPGQLPGRIEMVEGAIRIRR